MPDGTATRPIDILLVEDNPGDVRLTEEAIKDSGASAEVHHVRDGQDALAFLRREGIFSSAPRPDVVLLDLNLPIVHGSEVLIARRNDPDMKTIPVIILTASRDKHDIERSFSLHASHYLTKPVEPDMITEIVRLYVTHPPVPGSEAFDA